MTRMKFATVLLLILIFLSVSTCDLLLVRCEANPQTQSQFLKQIARSSPEIATIILRHALFIEDRVVTAAEQKVAFDTVQMLPFPARFIVDNRLSRVSKVSGNGHVKEFRNEIEAHDVTIYYNDQSISEISDVLVISEIGLKRISQFFDYVPRKKFGIYLFDSQEDRNLSQVMKYTTQTSTSGILALD
jgi:hypothetical protein